MITECGIRQLKLYCRGRAEDETFLDKDGNIVSVERFTPREIAETLLPDMTTVPMTDDEIKRFMES